MNHLIVLFFVTFSAAFMATVPPGLLNMSAAKISVQKGPKNAYIFSLGVFVMVLIQAYVAVQISKYLFSHPEVIQLLLKAAVVVFVAFAVFFFTQAKHQKKTVPSLPNLSKRNSFFKGLFLAGVNLLSVPYYSGLNAMWKSSGWINFTLADTLVFMISAAAGTFSVLYLYTVYFKKLQKKNRTFSSRANYILAALMLVLALITILRVFYELQ